MQTSTQFAPPLWRTRKVQCAFTVDVEDWFQSSVDFDAPITERVLWNMEKVLALLNERNVKATFFVQGLVAQKFPRLLQDLLAEGHEIQSHGHSHRPLFAMNREELRIELDHARKSVEDACGVTVTAFRAPDFSIVRENLWALEVLAESGFTVDSSIFPMAMGRYGIAEQPLKPHRVALAHGSSIVEAPVAVWNAGPLKMPVAGGGYFRLLPRVLLEKAFHGMLSGHQPVIVYCHPYEFSPDELDDFRGMTSRRFLFTQGLGRVRFVERVRYLLKTFSFGRCDDVLANWEADENCHSHH